MFEVTVNQEKQKYRSKPTMDVDISGSSASIPKPLTYDYMPEGYPKKDRWSIVWDGNTEGKVVVDAHVTQLYKISDMIPSDDDLLGAMVTFPDYPERVHVIASDEISAISDDVVQILIEGVNAMCVRKDNASVNGITIPEKGVYTISDSDKFKMSKKKNITPMSADFMPKNFNVAFRGELGHAPTSCNVTYNELRDWVERDIPVFAVFIIANAKFNITSISLLTDSLAFIYYLNGSTSKSFVYKSDGTFVIQPNKS